MNLTETANDSGDTAISSPLQEFGPDAVMGAARVSRKRNILRLILAVVLALGYFICFPLYLRHLFPNNSYFLLVAWFVPCLGIFLIVMPKSPNRFARGRRLHARGRYPQALRELSLAMQDDYPGAARLLGDMCLAGEGVPQSMASASAFYVKALDILDGELRLLQLFSGSAAFGQLKAESKPKIPKDIPGWLAGMQEHLERQPSLDDNARAVLADLRARQGDIPGALKYARTLPDRGGDGTPTPQAACLIQILNPRGAHFYSDMNDDADTAPAEKMATPGVKSRFWHITRVEVEQFLVFPALILLVVVFVYMFGIIKIAPLARLVGYGIIFLGLWLISRIGKQDRFPIGESHFLAGRYRKAARIFSKQYAKMEARSTKRLGDMHLDGLGVERDAEKAVAAYGHAFFALKYSLDRWDPDAPSPLLLVPGLTDNPEAREKWYGEILSALDILAAEGNEAAHELRTVMSGELERYADQLRYARAAYELSPTPANEYILARAVVEYDGSSAGEMEAALAILHRRIAAGEHRAGLVLIDHYSGRTGRKGAPDFDAAVAVHRDLLRRSLAEEFDKKEIVFALLVFSCRLMEVFGGAAVEDGEILDMMKMRENWLGCAPMPLEPVKK